MPWLLAGGGLDGRLLWRGLLIHKLSTVFPRPEADWADPPGVSAVWPRTDQKGVVRFYEVIAMVFCPVRVVIDAVANKGND